MSIKNALSALLGGCHVVDKKDSHDYSKKLDFNLYSKICSGEKISQNDSNNETEDFPEYINLGGPMTIILKGLKDLKGKECSVRCSKNTRFEDILKHFGGWYLLNFRHKFIRRDKTLNDYNIKDGDELTIIKKALCGGGDEFYIDDDLLDPSYDYDFRGINDENQKFYRGGLEYKRPCGWKRYALKVNGKYENDAWLGSTGKSNGDSEWAVSYHGTMKDYFNSIYNNGYRPGTNNLYGVGIYCTPNIETAAGYATEFYGDDGKKYKLVLQNRVRPSAIKKAEDNGGPSDYWYIENGKDIRPYSICVREC